MDLPHHRPLTVVSNLLPISTLLLATLLFRKNPMGWSEYLSQKDRWLRHSMLLVHQGCRRNQFAEFSAPQILRLRKMTFRTLILSQDRRYWHQRLGGMYVRSNRMNWTLAARTPSMQRQRTRWA